MPTPLNFLELASIHSFLLLLFLQKESQQPDRDVFFREYSHFFFVGRRDDRPFVIQRGEEGGQRIEGRSFRAAFEI